MSKNETLLNSHLNVVLVLFFFFFFFFLISECLLKWLHALQLKQYPYWKKCTLAGKGHVGSHLDLVSIISVPNL